MVRKVNGITSHKLAPRTSPLLGASLLRIVDFLMTTIKAAIEIDIRSDRHDRDLFGNN